MWGDLEVVGVIVRVGVWEVEEMKDTKLPGDKGLVLKSKAKHHAISALLLRPFTFDTKPLFVQWVFLSALGMHYTLACPDEYKDNIVDKMMKCELEIASDLMSMLILWHICFVFSNIIVHWHCLKMTCLMWSSTQDDNEPYTQII